MCRSQIHDDLRTALEVCHGSMIGPVDRPERFKAGDALDPVRLARELTERGHPSTAELGADAIVSRIDAVSRPGDVLIVFSSGGFGGIYEKLLS